MRQSSFVAFFMSDLRKTSQGEASKEEKLLRDLNMACKNNERIRQDVRFPSTVFLKNASVVQCNIFMTDLHDPPADCTLWTQRLCQLVVASSRVAPCGVGMGPTRTRCAQSELRLLFPPVASESEKPTIERLRHLRVISGRKTSSSAVRGKPASAVPPLRRVVKEAGRISSSDREERNRPRTRSDSLGSRPWKPPSGDEVGHVLRMEDHVRERNRMRPLNRDQERHHQRCRTDDDETPQQCFTSDHKASNSREIFDDLRERYSQRPPSSIEKNTFRIRPEITNRVRRVKYHRECSKSEESCSSPKKPRTHSVGQQDFVRNKLCDGSISSSPMDEASKRKPSRETESERRSFQSAKEKEEEERREKQLRAHWDVQYLPSAIENSRKNAEARILARELLEVNAATAEEKKIVYQEERTRMEKEALRRFEEEHRQGRTVKYIFDMWQPLPIRRQSFTTPQKNQAEKIPVSGENENRREDRVLLSEAEQSMCGTVEMMAEDEDGYAVPIRRQNKTQESGKFPEGGGLFYEIPCTSPRASSPLTMPGESLLHPRRRRTHYRLRSFSDSTTKFDMDTVRYLPNGFSLENLEENWVQHQNRMRKQSEFLESLPDDKKRAAANYLAPIQHPINREETWYQHRRRMQEQHDFLKSVSREEKKAAAQYLASIRYPTHLEETWHAHRRRMQEQRALLESLPKENMKSAAEFLATVQHLNFREENWLEHRQRMREQRAFVEARQELERENPGRALSNLEIGWHAYRKLNPIRKEEQVAGEAPEENGAEEAMEQNAEEEAPEKNSIEAAMEQNAEAEDVAGVSGHQEANGLETSAAETAENKSEESEKKDE